MSKRTDYYFTTLNRNGSTGVGVNPYRECAFRCVYCVSATQGTPKPWFGRDEVLEHLRNDLSGVPKNVPICLADCTDPYPPIEEVEGVTRLVLEELHRQGRPYRVGTKGTLVVRDIDILADYSVDHDVWMALGSMNEKALAVTEPGAPSPRQRIATMHKLADAGVKVTVQAAPWIPGASDADELVDAVPRSASVQICPLFVEHLGGTITLFGKKWTQSELREAFRAAKADFAPRHNVMWVDPNPEEQEEESPTKA